MGDETVRGILRQANLSDANVALFRDEDLDVLVRNGFLTVEGFQLADPGVWKEIFPGRAALWGLLSKTFGTSPAGGEPSAKRLKWSDNGKDYSGDFNADECDMRKWTAGSLVPTDGMEKVMESFGGFPPAYYVREEEIMVYKTIGKLWGIPGSGKPSGALVKSELAIVGSPGVGKSTFMVVLAFYLARCCAQPVLLMRKLRGGKSDLHTCVLLEEHRYSEIETDSLVDFVRVFRRLRQELRSLLYFVDGFTEKEVGDLPAVSRYDLLATSAQFRPKNCDPTNLVLLPAWQFDDLKAFSLKRNPPKGLGNAKDRYYFTGGSLREFCGEDMFLESRVDMALRAITSGSQALELMGTFGGSTRLQVDTVRRLYAKDRKNVEHYTRVSAWVLAVDSGYVLQELVSRCTLEQYKNMYTFTRAFGGAYYGWAFECYLHKLAGSGDFSILAQEYNKDGGTQEQYEIIRGDVTCEGTTESDCNASLRQWSSNARSTYWYPAYTQFPCIDAVAKFEKTTSDGQDPKKTSVLAYIQITVAGDHSLDLDRLKKLDELFQSHHTQRVYIAILPERKALAEFKLTPKPHATPVPLYVACLNEI